MSTIYLACPYSHPLPEVREMRYHLANRAAAHVMDLGHAVFSPISHSHPIADHLDPALRMDHAFWMAQDLPLLRLCDQVWVVKLQGWECSRGVNLELQEAKRRGLPVLWLDVAEFVGEVAACEESA